MGVPLGGPQNPGNPDRDNYRRMAELLLQEGAAYGGRLREYCMADVTHTHNLVNIDLADVELRVANLQEEL